MPSFFSLRQNDCEPLRRQVKNWLFMYKCCDEGNPEICFCCSEKPPDDKKCKQILDNAEKAQEELDRCMAPVSQTIAMTEDEILRGTAIIKYIPTTRSQYYVDPIVPKDIMLDLAEASSRKNTITEFFGPKPLTDEEMLKSLCEEMKKGWSRPTDPIKMMLDCSMPPSGSKWPNPPSPTAPSFPQSGELKCPDCLLHAYRCGPDYRPPPPPQGKSAIPYDSGWVGCLTKILELILRDLKKSLDAADQIQVLISIFIQSGLNAARVRACMNSRQPKRCFIALLLEQSNDVLKRIIFDALGKTGQYHRGAEAIRQWIDGMLLTNPNFLRELLERLRNPPFGEALPPLPVSPIEPNNPGNPAKPKPKPTGGASE